MSVRVMAVVGRGVVDPETPIIRGDDLGLTRGEGVFETMRVRNGRAFLFADHLRRLQASAARLEIPLPHPSEWQSTVADALAAYGADPGVLRMFATRGPDGLGQPLCYLLVSPIPAALLAAGREGTRAVTLNLGIGSSVRAVAPWLLGGVKATSYAVAMAAKREAEARGATDAIWISSDGEVLEEATSSVVWVAGGAAYTVPAETGILAGTTLGCLRALAAQLGTPIADRRCPVDELRAADEILLMSAVRGVVSALELDGKTVGAGVIGPVGSALHTAFETAFEAATPPS